MIKGHKVLSATALATMLVASAGSSVAFAAEKPPVQTTVEQQGKETQLQNKVLRGYSVKNGVKTPVYADTQAGSYEPAYPELPANPNQGVPQKGNIVSEVGNIGDIIYFDQERARTEEGKPLKGYIQKLPNGDIDFGRYDPDTMELCVSEVALKQQAIDLYKAKNSPLAQVLQDQLNAQKAYYGKAFDGQSKLKRETYYNLVTKNTTSASGDNNLSQAVTHGVATTNAFGFALTMGWKLSGKAGIPDVAEFTAEFSEQLTANYSHSIVVTDSKTETASVHYGPVNNPNYKYGIYTAALYQVQSTYTVQPGGGLQQIINDGDMGNLAKKVYYYNDQETYMPVTPGSHLI